MNKEQGQFQKEHLTISYDSEILESGSKSVTITFKGRFDMKYPSLEVMPYLMEIKDKIPTEQISNMYIDFNGLDYMNSAGIRTILMWMYKFIQDR
jgi:anti-anti-sigma regulatory factor